MWQLTNPITPRDAAEVWIESNGITPQSNFIPVLMQHGPLNSAALLIIGWDIAKIAQATPASSADNTITVTFSTYGSLIPNSGRHMTVSVAGLLGSNTTSGVLQLTSNSEALDPTAAWNQTTGVYVCDCVVRAHACVSMFSVYVLDAHTHTHTYPHKHTGTIFLTVVKTTVPHFLYTVSFVVENPVDGQEAPTLIHISAAWPITQYAVNRSTGAQAPLLVQSLLTRWIQQHDPGAGTHAATRCNSLQHTATPQSHKDDSWLLDTVTHCNTLQHTAIRRCKQYLRVENRITRYCALFAVKHDNLKLR